jgi:hypothetical protein
MKDHIMAHEGDFSRRPEGVRSAVEAFQAAAWRSPAATRFDGRPANDTPAREIPAADFLARADAIASRTLSIEPAPREPMPRWLIVAIGAAVAALLGALLGGALSVY